MKLLTTNYLNDSTVTATNENVSYPVTNLSHRFLEKYFKATGPQTTITVEFPEDRAVEMVAIGFNNITDSDDVYVLTKGAADTLVLDKTATDTLILQASSYYELRDSANTLLQTGELELNDDTVATYFDTVTCRKIVLYLACTPSETLYIGGVGVGSPLDIEYIQINPNMNIRQRISEDITDGGQSLRKYNRDLENFDVRIINISNEKRREIVADVRSTRKPIFVDLYPLAHDEYKPLYADVEAWGNFQRDSVTGTYNTSISVEERR